MVELLITAAMPSGPLQFVRGPILDGILLDGTQDERFATGRIAQVPLMIGTTSGDIPTWLPLSRRRFYRSFGPEATLAWEFYNPTGRGDLLTVVASAGADRGMHEPARRVFLSIATAGRALAAGVRTYDDRVWRVSGVVGLTENREESHADALAGMGDRGLGINAGVSLVRRAGLVSHTLAVSRGINDGAGASVSLGSGLMLPFSLQSAVRAGASLRYADARQMCYDVGISAEQADRRAALISNGDPRLRGANGEPYRPSGGLQSAAVNVAYVRVLAERWIVAGLASFGYLLGPAAGSPLTERRSSVTIGVGFGWKP